MLSSPLSTPTLPPLDVATRALFEQVRPNAHFAELNQAVCFISPSPMTHNPLPVARLAGSPGVIAAAIVHDFIPHEMPQCYLPDPRSRIDYANCLTWLSRYQLFLTNSDADSRQATRASWYHSRSCLRHRLRSVGDIRLTSPEEASMRHILMIGGSDSRKNADCLVRVRRGATSRSRGEIPTRAGRVQHGGDGRVSRARE